MQVELSTSLAYAWDQGTKAERTLSKLNANSRPATRASLVTAAPTPRSTRIACRTRPARRTPRAAAQATAVRSTRPTSRARSSTAKADHGMFLATGKTQPGPMVVTAKNDKGSHWLLLCRKVADDDNGMTKTKTFTDMAMAMIGTNPKTGRTCFFQNSIGSGKDGSKVPHLGDVEKSTAVWSSNVQNYYSGTCHGESAFVHSPWIDGAKRGNGKPIVPKAGEHPDFLISDLSAPYNIVAADKLGFSIPKQLVSDEVGACNNCHRLAGGTLKNFANWSTGTGEEYFSNITDFGKKFENSHWMAPRKDGITEATWDASKYGQALKFMEKCNNNSADPTCLWADVPPGNFNNPKVER